MKALQRVLNICMVAFLFIPALLPQHDMRAQETEQIILDYAVGIPEVEAGFQQPYKLVKIPELDIYSIPGKPVLPFKTARILIPYGEEIEDIQVIPGDRNYLGRFYIQPGQEAIPIDGEETGPTPPDTSIYNSARPYPAKPFSEVGIQWKRGFQILILNLYPLEYIPKSMDVSWFGSLKVIVNTKQAEINEEGLQRGLVRDKELISAIVDNPGRLSTFPPGNPFLSAPPILEGEYDYVIITNEALKNASEPNFQTLADWKESRGIKTTIVTVEDIYSNYSGDDNQEKIRNFIRDVYVNNGIEYVLLGGDADGGDVGGESGDNIVPVRGLWAWDYDMDPPNIPSDLYYACLDGNYDYDGDGIYGEPNDGPDGGEVDLMAEVYVGRAPVDSAEELSNFVTKTISYEQSVGDPYLKEVWMVGELLWEEGGCAAEEAVNRSDVTNPEGVLNSVRRFRDVAFNEEYVRLYYEYSPDVKRILIQEPKLLAELARLVVKHTPAIRYVAGDKGGKDIKLTETDIDGVISFVEKFKDEVKGREEKIGAPRVARMVALIEEFEEEANESEDKNFSEAFRSSIYSGMGGNARLEGETWGADYKDEIKDGSCNCGYCTEGFRDVYDAHTLYDRDYEGHDWPKSEVINIVNGNVHLINHLGHSNVNYVMKMNNDDADALTNSKYFFGYSQGCYAGSFDNRDAPSPYGYGDYLSYDCIAEHLVTNPTGAFAFIANSRFGWGQKKSTNGPSQYYDRQFWDAIFNERIANLGKANQDSKEDNIGHISSGVMRFCYYEINLLGDPETPLFDLRPQYEHDIAITEMHVRHDTEPGVSIVVQATVTNVGKNDESNVQIQLLEEDAVKDTTIIGILPSGSSCDVQFIWVSDIEGAHKLKVYAVPVNGEEYTDNNYQEDIIKVGRVILVDDDGEQCPVADFMSIQEAIQGASDGDILRVYPGTYRNFVVNKQIDLTGVGMPLVDGQREGNVIEIQADNVTLQGFRIINSGNDDNAGVLVESSHSVVTNNTVTSNQCGIGLNAASNNTISDNNVSGGEYGIFLESSCSNNDISRNMISSNDNGIYGYDSASAALSSPPPVLSNRISSNTLNNNHQSGYDDMGGNEWSENYWDDYVGEDVDGDGIGDTPYEIPGTAGAKDGHPLIEPISPFTIFLPCVLKGYRS